MQTVRNHLREVRRAGCGFRVGPPDSRRGSNPPESPGNASGTILRIVAVPVALLISWAAVRTAPSAVRLLSMWVHEFGHAIAAWVSGFSAMPGPWFTSVDPDRSRGVTALFMALISFGGFYAWQRRRWFWIGALGAILVVLLICTFGLYSDQAQQLIIFGGDAGNFVLGKRPDDDVLRAQRNTRSTAIPCAGAFFLLAPSPLWIPGSCGREAFRTSRSARTRMA